MAQSGVATAEGSGGGGRSRDGDAPVPDPSMIDLGIREVPEGLLSPFLVRLGVAPGAIWTEKYDWMPAGTHQHGRTADAETVTMLLCTLLSDDDDISEDAVLADLGLDTADLGDLWDTVREELADRTVGPVVDLGELDPQMTVSEAARVMASLLAGAGSGHDDAR